MDAISRWLLALLHELFGTPRRAGTTVALLAILYLVTHPAVIDAIFRAIIVPVGCLIIVVFAFRVMFGGMFRR